MASSLKLGQCIEGKLGNYIISAQIHRTNLWTATNSALGKVIIKTALKYPFENEREVLRQFRGYPCIRQLIDEIQEPPALVLRHLDDTLLSASNSKRLERSDIKFVAKRVLVALQALHEKSIVHTDVKPDNILVNYAKGPARFEDIELSDFGDVWLVDPKDHVKLGEYGHGIGAPMFRSPEAMLNLRWGTPTDIWSFGATLMSLLWGDNFHIFNPDRADRESDDEEEYAYHVMAKQAAFFGPFPMTYMGELLTVTDERLALLTQITNYARESKRRKPFHMIQDKEITEGDKTFLIKIMKLDPRDRPTAKELLQDSWFEEL